jgi:small acid-soluble spore protein I (minor)
MDIDIRQSIKNNFLNCNQNDIRESIENSIKENDEITLPGLGVLFEIMWNNIDNNEKESILNILEKNLNDSSNT